MPPVSRLAILLLTAGLLGALPLGCGESEEDEAFHDATEAMAEARQAVASARAAVENEEREVAQANEGLEKARERLSKAVSRLEEARQQVGRHATDEVLFREVQRKLLDDDALADVAIQAQVENGVVVLRGSVPSEKLRGHAEELADSTPGVVAIENRIAVAPAREG